MAKCKLFTESGERVEVEGRRFSHYVANTQFWFFVHKSLSGRNTNVTHFESGKKVCEITPTTLAACRNDKMAAAKLAIEALVAKVGAERVRSVLSAAER